MRHLRSRLLLLILLSCPGLVPSPTIVVWNHQSFSGNRLDSGRYPRWSARRQLVAVRFNDCCLYWHRRRDQFPDSGLQSESICALGAGYLQPEHSIDFGSKSRVVLRGSGANSTFIVFTGSSSTHCNTGFSMSWLAFAGQIRAIRLAIRRLTFTTGPPGTRRGQIRSPSAAQPTSTH